MTKTKKLEEMNSEEILIRMRENIKRQYKISEKTKKINEKIAYIKYKQGYLQGQIDDRRSVYNI